jgi:hypothetical protein
VSAERILDADLPGTNRPNQAPAAQIGTYALDAFRMGNHDA